MTYLRALTALAMLLGFYVLAIGIAVDLTFATFGALGGGFDNAGVQLGFLTLAVAFVAALWKVARAERIRPMGVELDEARTPELWHTVREIAAAADTRVPDEILLVPDVNAGVAEQTRLMGLIGGRRTLGLGVPLIQGLTRGQLRSVLAHELGHYSRAHTRLAPLTYRGAEAIETTVEHLSGVLGWLLAQWGKLYHLVNAAASRSQERGRPAVGAHCWRSHRPVGTQ